MQQANVRDAYAGAPESQVRHRHPSWQFPGFREFWSPSERFSQDQPLTLGLTQAAIAVGSSGDLEGPLTAWDLTSKYLTYLCSIDMS